jgi:N-acetyl-gamma-glutamyl-phosphate reductase
MPVKQPLKTARPPASRTPALRARPLPTDPHGRAAASAVVIGAAGYVGSELVGLLAGHPSIHLAGLFASGRNAAEQGARFGDLFPRYRGATELALQPMEVEAVRALKPDLALLATPHEASHDLVPELIRAGGIVLDLSAAYRLKDAAAYPAYYGFQHEHPDLLREAVYGLPEMNRSALRAASLIAVPGCYPTSAILPLRPLATAAAIEPGWQVIIDSTSGVSGAGRAPALKSQFCEVSLQPYGVFSHRHAPEIAAQAGTPVIFTPHLGAFDRGILSTMHVRLAEGWTGDRVAGVLSAAYAGEPFIRLLPAGQWPSIGAVRHTNFCDIGWAVHEPSRHLIVVSAIDNLLKGAAGQAVQCMNLRLGLPETTGLGRGAA